jgi:RNA polymerase sigma-70 factor (ECF subfamily)
VKLLKNDDEKRAAFYTALVAAHCDGLFKFAYARIRHNEDAEDVVEETLLIAWKRIDVLIVSPNPGGWLYNTLKNCIKKHFVSKKAEQKVMDAITLDAEGSVDLPEIDGERGIADLLAEDELHIINLKAQGYTHREIAQMLDVPYGTIASKVSRIKAKVAILPDE